MSSFALTLPIKKHQIYWLEKLNSREHYSMQSILKENKPKEEKPFSQNIFSKIQFRMEGYTYLSAACDDSWKASPVSVQNCYTIYYIPALYFIKLCK